MNDRIEELIVAYLHRGLTAEQERELFDSCRDNPDMASLLKQHVTMSLKLRAVRERAEVPAETRNELLSRINSLPAQTGGNEKEEAPARLRIGFGWRHIVSGGVAAAALTTVLFMFFVPWNENDDALRLASVAPERDTVQIVRSDTVTLTRTVLRFVSTRTDMPPATTESKLAETSGVSKNIADSGGGAAAEETAPEAPDRADIDEAVPPAVMAELRSVSGPSWIEQYSVMLMQLETVKLSPNDRIRQ
jgi:hypothetical protein